MGGRGGRAHAGLGPAGPYHAVRGEGPLGPAWLGSCALQLPCGGAAAPYGAGGGEAAAGGREGRGGGCRWSCGAGRAVAKCESAKGGH